MAVIPLYSPSPPHPDGSHFVRSPGGYEWWYFDAADDSADRQVVAIFFDGFVFHPQYLRRYARYRFWPTRFAPPVPGEYPCVYFAIYERGKLRRQFMTQVSPGDFSAAGDRVQVRVGACAIDPTSNGGHELKLVGVPWHVTPRGPQPWAEERLSATLAFTPRISHPPIRRPFFSSQLAGGAEHQWILADPLCDVAGEVMLTHGGTTETIPFHGRGYHDHNVGTAPIGPGLRRWIWGRVLLGDRVLTFHHAEPTNPHVPAETHLIEADAAGPRELPTLIDIHWSRQSSMLLRYPDQLTLNAGLSLANPRLLDTSPFYLRLTYDAVADGMPSRAFCEVAYPHRLRWPVLGRMIEMSIQKP